jgi:hypothetical protein
VMAEQDSGKVGGWSAGVIECGVSLYAAIHSAKHNPVTKTEGSVE